MGNNSTANPFDDDSDEDSDAVDVVDFNALFKNS